MPLPRQSPNPLPELIRRRAEQVARQLCDARLPPHVRPLVRLEVAVRGNTVTIVEERAPWNPAASADWTTSAIAQFRYQASTRLWTLCWADRNGRWCSLSETPPTADIAELARILDADTTGVFWG